MTETQVPYDRMAQLQGKIGISAQDLDALDPLREMFVARKTEFADYFYDVFYEIPEARIVLQNEKEPGLLKRVWAAWYESFFSAKLDKRFLAYLWQIGIRHVEVNLDHRFTNLGFSIIRQFCHKLVLAEVNPEKAGGVLSIFDNLLDLCLLVETNAFIENTTRCDLQVIREVADRVRNPSLVIGGNIKRLQRGVEKGSKEYKVYEMVMSENERLESMVRDIKGYMELFGQEPQLRPIGIAGVIAAALGRVKASGDFEHVKVLLELDSHAPSIMGDPKEMEYLFYCLILNGMEAADPDNPRLEISSMRDSAQPHNVRFEIFNTGTAPAEEEIEHLFSPFFSTKRAGTGFGLPVARMIVRKHYGRLAMEPVPGRGTKLVVTLPALG
jgi:signal transduction histidine kinase